MELRKQLAALLAAGALGFAVIGTALATTGQGGCSDGVRQVISAGVQGGDCNDESDAPGSEAPGSEAPGSEAPPSFTESQAPETDAPSEPVISEAPSEPVISEAPSEPVTSQPPSEPVITDSPPPSFFQSEGGVTDAPSEPDTATIGGSGHTGSPADGAWLLVIALGLLLASIVVLTPSRAGGKR